MEASMHSLCVGSCLHKNNITPLQHSSYAFSYTYTFQVCLTLWSKESMTFLTFCNVAFDWKFGLAKNCDVIYAHKLVITMK